jgi:hypothetical protein
LGSVGAPAPGREPVGAGHHPASGIPPDDFRARVSRALATGAVAWDPYD